MSTIVVTGAARGIGAAVASRFMRAGWDAILLDLDPRVAEAAERLSAEGRGSAEACQVDVSTPQGRTRVKNLLNGRPLAALVNNAGITRDALITNMTEDDFRAVVGTNLGAAYELVMTLQERLVPGASVINMSSKSANGNVGQYNYAVSKAGLVGLTRSLALRLAPTVRVNAVAPALVATDMTAAIPKNVMDRILPRIPLARPGEASEVAELIFWLATPAAKYITGQIIPICGGRSFSA